jgi:hypothetical protein
MVPRSDYVVNWHDLDSLIPPSTTTSSHLACVGFRRLLLSSGTRSHPLFSSCETWKPSENGINSSCFAPLSCVCTRLFLVRVRPLPSHHHQTYKCFLPVAIAPRDILYSIYTANDEIGVPNNSHELQVTRPSDDVESIDDSEPEVDCVISISWLFSCLIGRW